MPVVDTAEDAGDEGLAGREPAGQRAPAVPAGDDTVVRAAGQRVHADGEPVTGPRAPHGDGSGNHVRAVTRTVVGVGRDVDRVREHVCGGDTVAAEEGDRVAALVFEDALVADGVDGDLRAGLDVSTGASASLGSLPHSVVAGLAARCGGVIWPPLSSRHSSPDPH